MSPGSSVLHMSSGRKGRVMWINGDTAGVFFIENRGGTFSGSIPLEELILLSDKTPFGALEELTPEQIMSRLGLKMPGEKKTAKKDPSPTKEEVEAKLATMTPEQRELVKQLFNL